MFVRFLPLYLLPLLLCVAPSLRAEESNFTFQSYRHGMLRMTLVSPSIQGDVLLRRDGKLETLEGAALENLFTLRVPVPCAWLAQEQTLYWAVSGKMLMSAKIPPQQCAPPPPPEPQVRIFSRQDRCMIDTGGVTLWRVASELAKRNKATVYQNIYALFLTNKTAFADEDISRLRSRELLCPHPALVEQIAPDHAKRLFDEAVKFRSGG
ncbi:hypothetical protein FE240_06335 [Aeromonas simiae]|uniref:Uncharacterized protein n=1 Tax=Aeromonas simiae TaxID=218936 RepID=A0A5J6WT86_9GAMM|nr:hypothetical protein FE240_06335 [Aeromonas simiae]